jgi:hypothetical protein
MANFDVEGKEQREKVEVLNKFMIKRQVRVLRRDAPQRPSQVPRKLQLEIRAYYNYLHSRKHHAGGDVRRHKQYALAPSQARQALFLKTATRR